jgi:hypothetical protein
MDLEFVGHQPPEVPLVATLHDVEPLTTVLAVPLGERACPWSKEFLASLLHSYSRLCLCVHLLLFLLLKNKK